MLLDALPVGVEHAENVAGNVRAVGPIPFRVFDRCAMRRDKVRRDDRDRIFGKHFDPPAGLTPSRMTEAGGESIFARGGANSSATVHALEAPAASESHPLGGRGTHVWPRSEAVEDRPPQITQRNGLLRPDNGDMASGNVAKQHPCPPRPDAHGGSVVKLP